MKIYDTFIFYNEVELLKLRLDLLAREVDYVVIVEACQNFRGKKRDLVFPTLDLPYNNIRYIAVGLPDFGNGDLAASRRENYQRDCMLDGIMDAAPEDMIMFGDVDEIPDPRLLDNFDLYTGYAPVKLEQYLSYYAPNYRTKTRWYGTTVAKRYQFSMPVELRNRTIADTMFVSNAGWHMSYVGDASFIQEKLNSFSHADMIREYNTVENIEHALTTGKNLFGRDEHFHKVPLDDTFPPNMHKFMHLLKD